MRRIDAINSLIEAILKIPGKKIVTLSIDGEAEPFVLDISAEGALGYDASHEFLFKNKLSTAFKSYGGLIVRQFLEIKVERELPNGEKAWIPRKNIYGILISRGGWEPLPEHEVRLAHCTDARTGRPIPQEPDVSFKDFPLE
jgi:hypothetical protein